ncbi:hypothetical protein CLOL250_01356 [Clostridium sp. L2-50]|nr:hypothetical protein CLOL250_01356 [Clostridium sp. L2-50]
MKCIYRGVFCLWKSQRQKNIAGCSATDIFMKQAYSNVGS